MKHYGKLPDVLGHFPILCEEALFFLYMPISLENSYEILLPPSLERFRPLIYEVYRDEPQRFFDEVVYITAKHTFVSPTAPANRPGWHSDGFLTNDLNYVWYDALPTIFNSSSFEVEPDHLRSLEQFWPQAVPENDVTYPIHSLLKLDERVIHRVGDVAEPMFRTFVKISISRDHYNLTGNSRNYDLDYNWPMHPRLAVRNDPHRAQKETVK